ncbi:hypothetical protein PILCRDRAFT_820136 [Piloderma croceum F 1598]|uniref:F-box domain-containing protein n=1 Tax=Piloderma croceum (strain F 1598) TaxID=765440 RepID=A0A0C3B970_PILCF|nr:hypothetical protein PILCRDRAFT_820136 [Piloderma croceum F 1598]
MPAYEELLVFCREGLKNCINLRRCTWTRDGSVNSWILKALQECHNLRELEINGNHNGHYDAIILPQFENLQKISLIMPSGPVLDVLPSWINATGSILRSLTLICKASGLVTDHMLQALATNLPMLEHLHIVGCPKVTHKGVWHLVSANKGLIGLGLENLAQTFDMSDFSTRCTLSGSLLRLRSITLTINTQTASDIPKWLQEVEALLSLSPIEVFQVYSTFAYFDASAMVAMNKFCSKIVTTHGQRLTRFAAHRMRIGMDVVLDICLRCVVLEQLFVVAHSKELNLLVTGLAGAYKLRTVHINYPFEDGIEEGSSSLVLSSDEALHLVRQCGSTIVEFGCNTRVWQVNRVAVTDVWGRITIEPHLSPYENPDIPEQFMVVRS